MVLPSQALASAARRLLVAGVLPRAALISPRRFFDEPFFFGGSSRPRRATLFRPSRGVLDQLHEPSPGGLTVLGLRAVFAGIDDEHAFRRHAAARQRDEACLDLDRQRRRVHIETQCTAVATLLTFCPPGPEARTNRSSISPSSIASASVIRIMSIRGTVRRRKYNAA